MGIRKNAKFLTAAELEDFVKAGVLLKAGRPDRHRDADLRGEPFTRILTASLGAIDPTR